MAVPRKYVSEFGIHVNATAICVVTQNQLNNRDAIVKVLGPDFRPHIYMICRRPRVYIDPETFVVGPDTVKINLVKQMGYERESFSLEVPNQLGPDIRLRTEYPYTEFWIDGVNGENLMHATVAAFMADIGLHGEDLDLEVLYVGQSYGKDGDRNAIDRLQAHATLQSIYSEAVRRSPDKEIWLVLLSFERYLIGSLDGSEKAPLMTEDEDSAHIHNVIHNPITMQQEINFTEAALIRYFRPDYNEIFKDTFPSSGHTTYDQCYKLDLNHLGVEIQTESIHSRLWSKAVSAQWTHIARFALHDEAERRSMFDLSPGVNGTA